MNRDICRGRFIAPIADSSALNGHFDTPHNTLTSIIDIASWCGSCICW